MNRINRIKQLLWNSLLNNVSVTAWLGWNLRVYCLPANGIPSGGIIVIVKWNSIIQIPCKYDRSVFLTFVLKIKAVFRIIEKQLRTLYNVTEMERRYFAIVNIFPSKLVIIYDIIIDNLQNTC